MRNSWLILLLSLALAPSAFAHSGDIEMFTVGTTGRLTIDEQGRVAKVELDNKEVGKDILADYEKLIHQWRFEPVLVDGQPHAVTGYMRLGLIAFRKQGEDGVRLGMRSVQFYDPPSMQSESGWPAFEGKVKSPVYPAKPARAGTGATVLLMVKVDQAGEVADVAAKSIWLVGSGFGTPVHQRKLAAQFAKASEKAAAAWRFSRQPEGGVVLIPIRFTPPGYDTSKWVRTLPVPVETPQWVADASEAGKDLPTQEPGQVPSDRFRLLTQLDENRPAGFEG